ncbi:MAG: HAD family phosphatase [Deltaproteobacteria bacterium]|nr:HAD family phosphatase [Deltaproteobacteria bacterium]
MTLPSGSATALFLDLDGTLADSMPLMRIIYDEFLGRRGLMPRTEEFNGFAGLTIPRIMEQLNQTRRMGESPREMTAEWSALVDARYLAEVRPAPGAHELLDAAARRGVFTALVTSSPAALAREFLARHRLLDWFQEIVSAERVTRGKPDPEPFRLALDLSGRPAREGLAVEDALAGAMSATGAGLATYVMALTPPPEGLTELPGVRGVIRSLAELIPRLTPEPGQG